MDFIILIKFKKMIHLFSQFDDPAYSEFLARRVPKF